MFILFWPRAPSSTRVQAKEVERERTEMFNDALDLFRQAKYEDSIRLFEDVSGLEVGGGALAPRSSAFVFCSFGELDRRCTKSVPRPRLTSKTAAPELSRGQLCDLHGPVQVVAVQRGVRLLQAESGGRGPGGAGGELAARIRRLQQGSPRLLLTLCIVVPGRDGASLRS